LLTNYYQLRNNNASGRCRTTTVMVPRPRGTTSHNRTLSHGATGSAV